MIRQWVNFLSLALLGLTLCNPSVAQTDTDNHEQNHERMYQVELIIFSRAESNSQEQWPTNIKLSYPDNAADLSSESSTPEGVTPVPVNERLLNAQAATLAKSGSYNLLYHRAWRQMIYGNKRNFIISGGKVVNGHHELEGSISLSVAQFLKLQTNLWLTQFAAPGTPVSQTWPELPEVPFANGGEPEKQDYVIKRIAKFNQQRTMRSNEVHYIDHPLLGIIVKIIPYEDAHQ